MQTTKGAVIEFQGQKFEVCIDGNKTIILDANNVQVPNMKEFLRNVFSSYQIDIGIAATTHQLAKDLINYINQVPLKISSAISKTRNSNPPSVGKQILSTSYPLKYGQFKYLVPCCGRKISELTLLQLAEPFETLSFDNELSEYRDEIMAVYLANGNIINFNITAPAHKVYSTGRLYNAANSFDWNNGQGDQVYIISALFGIIKATDKIPLYNLSMTDNINGLNPKLFWQGKLDTTIENLTNDCKIVDLLSKNYRDSIPYSQQLLTNAAIDWNDNYGNHKGIWLRERLRA